MNHKVKKMIVDLKDHMEGADSEYINALSSCYRDYASVVFTLNYYILYESGLDYTEYKNEDISKMLGELSDYVNDYIIDDKEVTDDDLKGIDSIRQKVIKKTNTLLQYTAKFYLYEYILNRLEYNFNEPLQNSTIKFDDVNFANRVIEFIFDTQDNMVINEKIRAVLAQLPVRMTKTKFFDLLRESFTIYKGSSSDGLDSYLDRIKTSATIFSIEDTDDFSLLKSELSKFDEVDYASISEEEFKNLTEHYRVISKYLEVYTNFYSIYQGLVNNVYTCMLCKQYNENSKNDDTLELYKSLNEILSHLRECYNSGFTMEIADEVSTALICVEGVQEKSHELSMQLESGILDGLLDIYAEKDNKVKQAIIDLKKCSKLVSNSLFMELEDVKTCEVTNEMIEKITSALEIELKELFRGSQKVYTRAVMANVLSELPVFFKDIAEVSEYVTNQLTSCGNESEKMACYAILSDIMEEEY